MIMGVKYQTMCCKFPEELLQVACTHMQELIKLIPGAAEISYVKSIQERFMKVRGNDRIEVRKVLFLRVRKNAADHPQVLPRQAHQSLPLHPGRHSGFLRDNSDAQRRNAAAGNQNARPGRVVYGWMCRIYNEKGTLVNSKELPLMNGVDFVENVALSVTL